jgi:hypothetical protein
MSILINNWNGNGLIQSAVIAAAVSFGTIEKEIGAGSLVPRPEAHCN